MRENQQTRAHTHTRERMPHMNKSEQRQLRDILCMSLSVILFVMYVMLVGERV